jgi:hypothetical protein
VIRRAATVERFREVEQILEELEIHSSGVASPVTVMCKIPGQFRTHQFLEFAGRHKNHPIDFNVH